MLGLEAKPQINGHANITGKSYFFHISAEQHGCVRTNMYSHNGNVK